MKNICLCSIETVWIFKPTPHIYVCQLSWDDSRSYNQSHMEQIKSKAVQATKGTHKRDRNVGVRLSDDVAHLICSTTCSLVRTSSARTPWMTSTSLMRCFSGSSCTISVSIRLCLLTTTERFVASWNTFWLMSCVPIKQYAFRPTK